MRMPMPWRKIALNEWAWSTYRVHQNDTGDRWSAWEVGDSGLSTPAYLGERRYRRLAQRLCEDVAAKATKERP